MIERHSLPLSDGYPLRYSVFRGETSSARSSPLILCLHPGWSGELPTDYYGEQFLSFMFVPAFSETNAIILAPDCPSGAWNNPKSLNAIMALLDHAQQSHAIDLGKVTLVGYSAGGWGAWYCLQMVPDRFSSAIMLATIPIVEPVAQFHENFQKIESLLQNDLDMMVQRIPILPIYAIHSRADEVMPYATAMRVYQALADHNVQLEIDTIDGIGHFNGGGYVDALRRAALWLTKAWDHANAV
ncbi:MAG: alpha/beta fold hydrolase [Anaerolineales bacterium]